MKEIKSKPSTQKDKETQLKEIRNTLVKNILYYLFLLRTLLTIYQVLNASFQFTNYLNFTPIKFTLFKVALKFPFTNSLSTGQFAARFIIENFLFMYFIQQINSKYYEYMYKRKKIQLGEKNDLVKKAKNEKANKAVFLSIFVLVAMDGIGDILTEFESMAGLLLRRYTWTIMLSVYIFQFIVGGAKRILNILYRNTNEILKSAYMDDQPTGQEDTNPFFENFGIKIINIGIALFVPSMLILLVNVWLNQISLLNDYQKFITLFGHKIMIINNMNNKLIMAIVVRVVFDMLYRYIDFKNNKTPHIPHFNIRDNDYKYQNYYKHVLKFRSEFNYKECLSFISISIMQTFIIQVIVTINNSAMNVNVIDGPHIVAFAFISIFCLSVISRCMLTYQYFLRDKEPDITVLSSSQNNFTDEKNL